MKKDTDFTVSFFIFISFSFSNHKQHICEYIYLYVVVLDFIVAEI